MTVSLCTIFTRCVFETIKTKQVLEWRWSSSLLFPHAYFQIQIKRNGCSAHPTILTKLTPQTIHRLSKGLDNYFGDFNSEFSEPCLNDFCEICNLKNLVKEPTCYKNPENLFCIDLFLSNRPRTFQCTTTIEADISNFHKLVAGSHSRKNVQKAKV